jgi:DivIVA domain-containing protein
MARLSPEEISNRKFSSGGLRGYDRDEVERFLAEVARAYREVLESARVAADPSYEQLGREVGAVLESARLGADSLRRRAEEEAEGARRKARHEADQIRGRAEREASEILERGAVEAERAMREAELVARRLRNVTKRQCSELLAEAHARQERLRAHERELRGRIAEIEAVFAAFREEMDSEEVRAVRIDDPELEPAAEDQLELTSEGEGGTAEESGPIRLPVEQVQPKPVFENRPGR